MATNQSLTEQTWIRIDIDGEKYRLQFSDSSHANELRPILSNRYHISPDTCFIDSDGYTLHPDDEKTIVIRDLLNKDNIIQLKTIQKKLLSTPERKSESPKKEFDPQYVSAISQLRRCSSVEVKLSGSSPTQIEDKIILATDLDLHAWKELFAVCNLFQGIQMDREIPRRAFKSLLKFKDTNEHYPYFQINDNTNIRIYMKEKEMQSSFLSSQFFDGGIKFSHPFIGIGINAEYIQNQARTNTQRKTYLTYCYNFPRVTLELDLSYLEPTDQFLEDIDHVLKTLTPNEQIIQLQKVLSTYGHVYARSIVLGAHLYHTQIHENKENAQKAQQGLNANLSFSLPYFLKAKIHPAGGSEKQFQGKSSEQTALWNFEAVGGDTRLNCDPTLWSKSITDPSLWRIIEQDDYQSVITVLDQERQNKIQKIFNYYSKKKLFQISNIPNIPVNTQWIQNGITVGGGNEQGNGLHQLDHPKGASIDADQTVYVADTYNHRIVAWKSDAITGQVVAGGNGKGDRNDQLHVPCKVVIDRENDFLLIADYGNNRIVRWSRQNGQSGEIIISNVCCSDLAMDDDGFLYVCDDKKHEVRRWRMGETKGTIVAGGNEPGNRLDQLHYPRNIFVDADHSVYISDHANYRVMKWMKDAKEGMVVAGGQGAGNSLRQFSFPGGIVVNQLGTLYVVDVYNHRVMRWCKGAREGSALVGGNGAGKQVNQFNGPQDLSFDQQNNLYVVDFLNNRVQKFSIHR